jgi:hypothetical protein
MTIRALPGAYRPRPATHLAFAASACANSAAMPKRPPVSRRAVPLPGDQPSRRQRPSLVAWVHQPASDVALLAGPVALPFR